MGIKLSTDDQIIVLQRARGISEWLKYLSQVDFDIDLIDYATELSGIKDIIQDSCVLSLKTNQEIDAEIEDELGEPDYRHTKQSIYNETRI